MAQQTLLIAYGNPSRQDDGAAYHVVMHLRLLFGLKALSVLDAADEELQPGLRVVYTQQLVPEMSAELAEMDCVVFIDAHVDGAGYTPVHWQEIFPRFQPGAVSHHFAPSQLLAWSQSLYQRVPRAYILSVLGTRFDFGLDLSPETAERAREAAFLLVQKLGIQPAP